jgi:uncharacterized membrane protein
VNAKHLIEYPLFLYESIEAVHVIAVISWKAGKLYLPRQVLHSCDHFFEVTASLAMSAFPR